VLALRCLLLPALLRPQATGAAALAELLQQQLLPVTRDLEQALVHDVGLLRAVRGLGCGMVAVMEVVMAVMAVMEVVAAVVVAGRER
jgi:hypothetical protein